jgi:phage gp16-like protein
MRLFKNPLINLAMTTRFIKLSVHDGLKSIQVLNKSCHCSRTHSQNLSKKTTLLGHIKKNSWLASSPAHKKGPAQDFLKFFI